MTAEARRIARRARRLGYSAVTLGNATERHWDALRVILDCEHVSELTLANAVDAMLAHEQDATQVGV